MSEILDGRALTQKLRVGDHLEPVVCPAEAQLLLHPGSDFPSRPHRHRAFIDNHLVAIHRSGNGTRRIFDVPQVGASVIRGGGSHRDEDHVVRLHGGRKVRRERQPAGLRRSRNYIVQPGLENRDLPRLQPFDLAGIDIHACHLVSEVRKACPADQAYVAGADDGYGAHRMTFVPSKSNRKRTSERPTPAMA